MTKFPEWFSSSDETMQGLLLKMGWSRSYCYTHPGCHGVVESISSIFYDGSYVSESLFEGAC